MAMAKRVARNIALDPTLVAGKVAKKAAAAKKVAQGKAAKAYGKGMMPKAKKSK